MSPWYSTPLTSAEAGEICDEIERRCLVKIPNRPTVGVTAAELLDGLSSQSVIGGDVSRIVEIRSRALWSEWQRALSRAGRGGYYRAATATEGR